MLKLILFLARKSPKNRALILNYLLENVQALPFKDIIEYDLDGTIKIGGNHLTPEQVVRFKSSADSLKNNWTYQVIKEQMAFEAIKIGIHSSNTTEQLLFAKAVLWIQQREIELIKKLSGEIDEN